MSLVLRGVCFKIFRNLEAVVSIAQPKTVQKTGRSLARGLQWPRLFRLDNHAVELFSPQPATVFANVGSDTKAEKLIGPQTKLLSKNYGILIEHARPLMIIRPPPPPTPGRLSKYCVCSKHQIQSGAKETEPFSQAR